MSQPEGRKAPARFLDPREVCATVNCFHVCVSGETRLVGMLANSTIRGDGMVGFVRNKIFLADKQNSALFALSQRLLCHVI